MLLMVNGYERRVLYQWRGLELLLKDVELVQIAWAGAERFEMHLLGVGASTLLDSRMPIMVQEDVMSLTFKNVILVLCFSRDRHFPK